MLERMGWSKGKGLGVQEQGNTEHIKVRVKNNTLGLGAAVNYEDSWLAHQDDFNQLLAELNNCHGQAESEPAGEQKTTFSLEEKSRSSRKRVHYMKFAKGKDLSSRSEDDLSCIFGKRQTAKTEEDNTRADSPEEDRNDPHDMPTPVDQSNTVTSTMTVQEYFAKRMAKRKKFPNEPESELADPHVATAQDSESSQGPKSKSKKKKKSHKNVEAETMEGSEKPKVKPSITDGSRGELETPDTEYQPGKKKKKAKDRRRGEDNSCDGNACVFGRNGKVFPTTSDRENLEENSEAKQKKPYKKKHKKQKKEAAESVHGVQRKKKKHSP